ncbi:MAG: hypothetical protein ACLVI5_13415 [Desulfovibrio piger]|uniref:hypothetical protein n=1 Tax=Desulfovibrio piger TaxID=901 RepID=UPI00399B7098
MALSEKEKDWLERRAANEMAFDAFFCPHCEQFNVERDPYLGHCDDDSRCPLTEHDFRDAAEFEARVQKWLMYQYEKAYQCKEVSDGFLPDRGTMLMFARLAAEAEMDA